MYTLKKILYFLNPSEKKHFLLILIMTLIMSLINLLGVASIMPFLYILVNPSIIETNLYLNVFFEFSSIIGITNKEDFIFLFGILVLSLLIFSIAFKALTTYLQIRFVQMQEYSISKRLVETYLSQPYSWFLDQNSAALGKSILSEANLIKSQVLYPFIILITNILVASSLIVLLFFVDYKLTLIIGVILGGSYLLIFNFSRNFLTRIGKDRLEANNLRFKSISEAFGASKEIKLSRLEKFYIERFSYPALVFAKHLASAQIISQIPRFIIEMIVFGGMMMLVLYLISKSNNFYDAIPIIALYAFAGYRLLPSLQSIYSSNTSLKFSKPALNAIYSDLKKIKINKLGQDQNLIQFKKSIKLKNINYRYPNSSRTILKNINLKIPYGAVVGLVGPTGCGKTTTVDIIIGLLENQEGILEVDDQIITKNNLRSWQSLIGYVPQNIYLSDDTIASNIAFGQKLKDIDQHLVEKAAKVANLNEFITNELPDNYQTVVGERGTRLSGGQRQRLGIARAIYNNPKVLILDEATSALDSETERETMKAINNLSKEITIIIIAHRINTLKKCDIIYKLDKGEVKTMGTYDELFGN
jgi:ABC-type multidrug transport system fused ATPase/permease subunit